MDKVKFQEMLEAMGINATDIEEVDISKLADVIRTINEEDTEMTNEVTTTTTEATTEVTTSKRDKLVGITSKVLATSAVGIAIGADLTKRGVVASAKATKDVTKDVVIPVTKEIGAATKASVKARWAEYMAKKSSK